MPQLNQLWRALTGGTFNGWTLMMETLDRLGHHSHDNIEATDSSHGQEIERSGTDWHGLDDVLDLMEGRGTRVVLLHPPIDTAAVDGGGARGRRRIGSRCGGGEG
jgi:hypothetical protein